MLSFVRRLTHEYFRMKLAVLFETVTMQFMLPERQLRELQEERCL